MSIPRHRMSACIFMLAGWDVPTAAKELAGLGFGGIGLTRPAVEEVGHDATRTAIERHDLKVSSYVSLGLIDLMHPERIDADEVAKEFEFAATIGADCLVTLPGTRGQLTWTQAGERLEEQLGSLAATAKQHDLMIAIEPIHPLRQDLGYISALSDLLDVFDSVDDPACGAVVDSWHLWWQRDVWSLLPGHADRIASIQLSDHKEITLRSLDRAQVGTGIIPWDEFFSALAETAYSGLFEFEIISDDHGPDDYRRLLSDAADWLEQKGSDDNGLR
jgi:sugar phosphate isomerase/epimerase